MAATSFLAASLVRRATVAFALSHPLLLTSSKLSCRRTLISFPLTPRLSSSASEICHLAQAIKGDVDGLLKGVADKTVIEEVKRVLEMARRASSRREVLHTNFLTPPVVKESMLALEKLADLKVVVQGGYPQAERCRISVGHPEVLTSDPDVIAALSITGNFGFQPCSHGDFLGAILGTGISREKLGDIILQGEKGAQVIVVPELVDFIISSLDKVGNVPVSFKRIPLIALDYEPPRTKSFKTIEASVRVDAIASAGFKLSRTKLVDLICDGDVRVNWTPVTKNGATLKTGDIVSVRGKGRLKIGEINPTKKGKFAVELILYLHLAYNLTSRCFTTVSRPLAPPFSSRFFPNPKPRHLSRPNSLAAANISTASSDPPTPSAEPNEPFASPFLSVQIRCQKHVADILSEALLCFGASSTSIDEEDDNDGKDEICIDSIFPEGEDVKTCISRAADSVSLKEMPSYEVKMGEQFDWITKTQESFHPVEVTEGLWIVPEWRIPPDAQATNIILNPGLAFGTGEHATTKLCLLLLRRLIKGRELFLDYGTGSGILAIAAVKFGAALSVGIDIDPQAITSARQNAALNNIGPEKMQLHLLPSKTSSTSRDSCGGVEDRSSSGVESILETNKYDVVIANILLNPLLDLADHIVSYAKPGAVVGLSGMISEQLPHIVERYSQLLEDVSITEMDDWACVHGTKKQNLSES
ncbi:hypothetical protein COP2_007933 [Malus domestica]